MRVVWTGPALRQLEEIEDYIAQDNPIAAFEVTEAILNRVNKRLPDHPGMGRPGRTQGTRELVISDSPYIVAYRIVGSDIQILAVMHGAQKWPKAFS